MVIDGGRVGIGELDSKVALLNETVLSYVCLGDCILCAAPPRY
jgi:hypothetical protein